MLGGQQWIADVVAPPSFAVWPTKEQNIGNNELNSTVHIRLKRYIKTSTVKRDIFTLLSSNSHNLHAENANVYYYHPHAVYYKGIVNNYV